MVHSEQDRQAPGVFYALMALALFSMLACAATGLWLYWGAAPQVARATSNLQTEIARTQATSDGLVASQIAIGLAGGDYGEVQEILARAEKAGYLARAVVVNAGSRIVAILDRRAESGKAAVAGQTGKAEMFRVGESLPNQIADAGRKIDISLGSRNLGRLLILDAPAPAIASVNDGAAGLRAAGILMAALSLLSAGVIAWLWSQLRMGGIAPRTLGARTLGAAKGMELLSDTEVLASAGGAEATEAAKAEFRRRVAELRARRTATNNPVPGDKDEP